MRNATIDNIKGIGILLVVLAHVWTLPESARIVVYAFHMPMFFILSGYLFNEDKHLKKGFRAFAKERVARLYLPAIVIGFSCAVPSIVFGKTASVAEFIRQSFGVLYGIPTAKGTFYCNPIWFLLCLLGIEMIYFALSAHLRRFTQSVVFGAFFIGFILSALEVDVYLPLALQGSFAGLLFYHIGQKLRDTSFIGNHRPKVLYAVCAVAILGLAAYFNTPVRLASNNMGNPALLVIGSLAGSYLVLCIARVVPGGSPLTVYGVNTILILGYNFWVDFVVRKSFDKAGLPDAWYLNFAAQAVIFYAAARIIQCLPTVNRWVQGVDPKP